MHRALGLHAAAQVCGNTTLRASCLVLLSCALTTPTSASHALPPPPSAQVIVLHAENPWGNKFGNIPAVLFGYIGDDGVLDFAVCGNPLYANFFLNPDTARAPPTAPTLKVRPGGTLVGGPCCMWPHPLTSTDFQGCHLPALGFLMLLYAFLRVPAPRHTPLQTDTLPSLPSSLARPPPLPPANKPPNCAGNLHQRSV